MYSHMDTIDDLEVRLGRTRSGSSANQPTKKEGCDRGHCPHPLMLPILFYVVRTVCVASSKQQQLVPRATHKYPVDRRATRRAELGPDLDHPLHPHNASASTSFSFLRPTTSFRRCCCLALGVGRIKRREEGEGGKQKQPKQQLLWWIQATSRRTAHAGTEWHTTQIWATTSAAAGRRRGGQGQGGDRM